MTTCDQRWARLMRAANRGDDAAYRSVLTEIAAHVRGLVRGRVAALGLPVDVEDVAQETLLAVHLRRGTWREDEPIRPWLRAIARNKLVDALRRRGRSVQVSIDDVADTLVVDLPDPGFGAGEAERLIASLPARQRDIVRSVSIDGVPVREVAVRLSMTEGAVRVALHRALRRLAQTFGSVR